MILAAFMRVLGQDLDVFRTSPLGALPFRVLYFLSFAEALIALALDCGTVEEDISPLALDESKTLFSQLLNSTLRHFASLLARRTK